MAETTITGFDELADELEEFADDLESIAGEPIEEALDTAIDRTAWRVFVTTWYNAPVDEGDLRRSIAIDEMRSAPMERWIIVDQPYARAIEYGRDEVHIFPKYADALRFEIDGRVVYAQHVKQPPRTPQPFLRPALMQHESTLRRDIRREIRKVFRNAL